MTTETNHQEDIIIRALQTESDKLVASEELIMEEAGLPEHKEDARGLFIDHLAELTDRAKSAAQDYTAADAFAIVALAVAITSPNLLEDSYIKYEDSGDLYYDVLAVSGGYRNGTMNIPVPLVNPKFIETLKRKLERSGQPLEQVERGEHNRTFDEDPEVQRQEAEFIYKSLGKMANTAAIEHFAGIIYDSHTYEGKQKIRSIVTLIRECREAVSQDNGIEDLARKRLEARRVLYGSEED